jgi:hypothetical protein
MERRFVQAMRSVEPMNRTTLPIRPLSESMGEAILQPILSVILQRRLLRDPLLVTYVTHPAGRQGSGCGGIVTQGGDHKGRGEAPPEWEAPAQRGSHLNLLRVAVAAARSSAATS